MVAWQSACLSRTYPLAAVQRRSAPPSEALNPCRRSVCRWKQHAGARPAASAAVRSSPRASGASAGAT